MTGEQREHLRREVDRLTRRQFRRRYGRDWLGVRERLERELLARSARTSVVDIYSARRSR